MTAIPLEVLVPQVTSRCSQGIVVNFGQVAAGVSPRAYVQCGIKVGVRDSTGIFCPIKFAIGRNIAQARFRGGGRVTRS